MKMSTVLCNGPNKEDVKKEAPFVVNMVPAHFPRLVKIENTESEYQPFRENITEENMNLQMANMNDLLIIHLDFIQLQAEQLVKKDKQVEDLKNENEMLKQRLARMERRVSLQRTRSDKQHKVQDQKSEGTENANRKRRAVTQEPQSTLAASPQAAGKKPFAEPAGKKQKIEPLPPKKLKQDTVDQSTESEMILENKLTTGDTYYTLVGDTDAKWFTDHLIKPKSKVNLEVPLWRLKAMTSTYTMEGTENLSDDVFERRHYKLMIDEKKRKRWDVQRIREQRQIEKLRSRGKCDQNKSSEHTARSLWPQPGDGLKLAVTTLIPVSVFGINLPSVQTQEFTLPWKDSGRGRKKSKR